MAIYWPTASFKGRTFKLCVLNRWDFNFCVRSSPLREPGNMARTCTKMQYMHRSSRDDPTMSPQWRAVDAEIKVPSGDNTELKRSPFQAWSRSVYSHSYCKGFVPCLFFTLPVHSPAFFPKLLPIFPMLAVANACFLCRPAEEHRPPCWMPVPVLSARGI